MPVVINIIEDSFEGFKIFNCGTMNTTKPHAHTYMNMLLFQDFKVLRFQICEHTSYLNDDKPVQLCIFIAGLYGFAPLPLVQSTRQEGKPATVLSFYSYQLYSAPTLTDACFTINALSHIPIHFSHVHAYFRKVIEKTHFSLNALYFRIFKYLFIYIHTPWRSQDLDSGGAYIDNGRERERITNPTSIVVAVTKDGAE